jgi:WD40 repeat protein
MDSELTGKSHQPAEARIDVHGDVTNAPPDCFENFELVGTHALGSIGVAEDSTQRLGGEPIAASQPRKIQRFSRWVRRNPSFAFMFVFAAILTLGGLFGSIATSLAVAASARSSQGIYLAAQSELVRRTNPGIALALAVEAADRHHGAIANNAVLHAMEANREVHTLLGHSGKVTTVTVLHNSRHAVTGSDDNTARVWDIETGRQLVSLPHNAPVLAVRYSDGGRQILTLSSNQNRQGRRSLISNGLSIGDAGYRVIVWDTSTGARMAEWTGNLASPSVDSLEPMAALDGHAFRDLAAVTFGGSNGQTPRILQLAEVRHEHDARQRRTRARVLPKVLQPNTLPFVELRGHDAPVHAIAFSPNGLVVATGSSDQSTRLWDAFTGEERRRCDGHIGQVIFVTFSVDNRLLLTVGNGQSPAHAFAGPNGSDHNRTEWPSTAAEIWDVGTGERLAGLSWPSSTEGERTSEQMGLIRRARFHPDGSRVYTFGGSSVFGSNGDAVPPVCWDVRTGAIVSAFRREESGARKSRPTDFAVSGDGRLTAVSYDDGLIRLLSDTGTFEADLRGHTGAVRALEFTREGRQLVSASDDGTVRVWDVRVGAAADAAQGRWPFVEHAVFTPDGRRIAALVDTPAREVTEHTGAGLVVSRLEGEYGRVIEFRDAARGRVLARTPTLVGEMPVAPQFSADGNSLLVRTLGGPAVLYDVGSGRLLATYGSPARLNLDLVFSPDSRSVATADGEGHIYDDAGGADRVRLPSFPGHQIHGIRFNPDGTKIVTLSSGPSVSSSSAEDISACLWDARDGRLLSVLKDSEPNVSAPVVAANFSPDGRRLVTASHDATARIWDVAHGRERVVLRGHSGPVRSAIFSLEGWRVLTASEDGTARLWSATDGRELARLSGHRGAVASAVFSPNGNVILTYGDDYTARLWDGQDGHALCTLIRHDVAIRSASFSPDSRVVVVCFLGQPGSARVWPIDFLAAARRQRPRALTSPERAKLGFPEFR